MIKLGDEVRDPVSGFQGIAVSRHIYLQGCDRIAIQPVVDSDGKLPEVHSFDEPQLEVITVQKVKRKADKENTGGPAKYPDLRRY